MTPFTKHKDFHVSARNHISSKWHRNAHTDAKQFMNIRSNVVKRVVCQIDTALKRLVQENRKNFYGIVPAIVFCATHDLALREKSNTTANMKDLIMVRIEDGDATLQRHIEEAPANALFTSR